MTCEAPGCTHDGLWNIDLRKWYCKWHLKKLGKYSMSDVYRD